MADLDLLKKSQRLFDTADGQKEEKGHAGYAFLAGHPYSQAAWAASLTSTGAFNRAFYGAYVTRSLAASYP